MIRVDWKLVPLRPPTVLRRCPRCNSHKDFLSSGKFRINGHGRRLDVWLIYKCSYCEQTWNCTILSRVTPESIGKKLLTAFEDNDEETSWRYAFDRELMKRNGSEMALEFDYRVDGPEVSLDALPAGETLELAIGLDYPMNHVRTDSFIGDRLGLSHRQLEGLFARGQLTIEPAVQADPKKKLKRPIVARLDVDAARASLAASAAKQAEAARRAGVVEADADEDGEED